MNKKFIILSSVLSWALWASQGDLELNVKNLIKDHYFVEARDKLKEISNQETYLKLKQLFTETVKQSLTCKYEGCLKFYKEHEKQGYTNTSLKTDLLLLKKLKKIDPVGEIERCIFDKFIPQHEEILKEKAKDLMENNCPNNHEFNSYATLGNWMHEYKKDFFSFLGRKVFKKNITIEQSNRITEKALNETELYMKEFKIDQSLKLKPELNIVLSIIGKNIKEFQNRNDVIVAQQFLVNNLDVVKNLEQHNFEKAKKIINSFNQEHIKSKLTKELNESYKNSIKDRFETLKSEMSRFAKSDTTSANTKQFYEKGVLAIKSLTKETARGEEEKALLEVEIPQFVKKIEGALNYWKQEEDESLQVKIQIEQLKKTLSSTQNIISIICSCGDHNCTINQLNKKNN